jgi:hypothetical protein
MFALVDLLMYHPGFVGVNRAFSIGVASNTALMSTQSTAGHTM